MVIDSLIPLTTIPDLSKTYSEIMVGAIGLDGESHKRPFKTYDLAEVMSWLSSSTTENCINPMGSKVAAAIKNFMKPETEDGVSALVNKHALELIGVDPAPLIPILERSCGAVPKPRNLMAHGEAREAVIMSMFLNTHGFIHGVDMEKCFQESYLRAVEGGAAGPKGPHKEKKTEVKHETYENVIGKMSPGDLKEMCAKYRNNHVSSDGFQTLSLCGQDEVGHKISPMVRDPCLNVELVLNEVTCQTSEQDYLERAFLEAVDDWVELSPDDDEPGFEYFISKLSNNVVDILNDRESVLRKELYNIALPNRYQLDGMENSAVLDVILNTLLGADMSQVKSFFEMITFANVKGVKHSTHILSTLAELEAQLSMSGAEQQTLLRGDKDWTLPDQTVLNFLTQCTKIEWGRQMCFILFLELTRRIIPSTKNMRVGTVGSTKPTYKDFIEHDTDKPSVRVLTKNTIYYCRGYYYGKWDDDGGYCSPCYKRLLVKALETLKYEEETV